MSKYEPTLEDGWEDRAEQLYENSVLSERRAQVQALTEYGQSRQEIADRLDISINTVDEHRQKIKARIDEAEWTIDELAD